MSEQENLDISKVIGIIMENPALIEQISSLAKQHKDAPPPQDQSEEETPPIKEKDIQVEKASTYPSPIESRGNRAQLLCALKPYVSEERAKAIDSMISIADILDMMRAR